MLIDEGAKVIRESECLNCRRLFCAQCGIPWHSSVNCEEFQELDEDDRKMDDLMVMELVKEKKWMRCPECQDRFTFFFAEEMGCYKINKQNKIRNHAQHKIYVENPSLGKNHRAAEKTFTIWKNSSKTIYNFGTSPSFHQPQDETYKYPQKP